AVVQVEDRPVQPALQRGALDLAFGQGDLAVGADVPDGVVLTVLGAGQRHFHQRAVGGVQFEAHRLTWFQVVPGGHHLCSHLAASVSVPSIAARSCSGSAIPVISPSAASNSASISVSRRSSTSGTPILAISSAKNPRTTRR